MAFELAAANPDCYRGAICFSPGRLTEASARLSNGSLAEQRYVFTAGEGEHESTLSYVRQDAAWCQRFGANVRVRIYPGVETHGFPEDFLAAFPGWLQWVNQRP